MLPVCSATTCCSCHAKVLIHGGLKSFSPYWNSYDFQCSNVDKVLNFSNSVHLHRAYFKTRAAACFYYNYIPNGETDGHLSSLYQSRVGSVKQLIQTSYLDVLMDQPHHFGPNSIIFVDSSGKSAGDDQLMNFISMEIDNTDALSNYADPESATTGIDVLNVPPPGPDSLNIDVNSSSGQEKNLTDTVSEMNGSIADTINEGEKVINNLFDTFTSSLKTALTDANEAFDNAINEITSFINNSGESAGNKLTGLANGVKEASGRAGVFALDALRGTIGAAEDSLIQGAKAAGYAYSSTKEFLPPELQEALSLSEESIIKVLNPAGTAFQQVYLAVEGLEKRLGLDPNDPLVPVVLFLGVSATLWGSYRVLKYSGYAGDLCPKSTLELLQGNDNAVLIDIRPENLRERDGIPDLRRAARYRYTSVTLPEVDVTVKKLLRGGSDVEDSLLAAVICNLKIVEHRSKVLVMDADGTCSKGVARSLRKLGIKRPYLVQGGFQSWLKEGIRVKVLKAETALTVLNEDAEAILEEINATPLKLTALGLGFAAAVYSLVEWEKTLQFIAVIGLGQTIMRRVATYQNSEDIKKDLSLLLVPVQLGGEAILWFAGKLETNINGLPMSPSSSDVQSRVLQAAAKHESQPSDGKESQDSSQVASSSSNENMNASEA